MSKSLHVRALMTGAVLSAAFVLVGVSPAHAATTYTWSGMGNSDDWSDSGNWAPVGVPGNGDSVVIAPPDKDHCYAHPTDAPSGVTLTNLDLHMAEFTPGSPCDASLDGGSLAVSGSFAFHGGVLGTVVSLGASSTGIISPNITDAPENGEITGGLTTAGTLTVADNTPEDHTLDIGAGAALTSTSSAVLAFTGSNEVAGLSCCVNPPRVVNHGTLRISGGKLELSAVELDQNGVLDTTSGDALLTQDAPNTAATGASYTGSGYWQLGNASTSTLTGVQTLGQDFSLILGGPGISGTDTLDGTFSLAGGGTLDWEGGMIDAALTVDHSALLKADAHPGDDRRLDGEVDSKTPVIITNHGTISFTHGAGYYASEGGTIANQSDGVLDVGPGTTLTGGCCLDPGVIGNAGGKVVVAAGADPATFENQIFHAVGGTTTIAAGQRLALTGGARSVFSGSPLITGGGTLDVVAPVTASGALPIASGTTFLLHKYPGTLDGTAAIGGAGRFAWRGGEMSGKVTLSPAGGSVVGGPIDPAHDDHAKHIGDIASGHPSTVRFTTRTTLTAGTSSVPNETDLDGEEHLVFAGGTTMASDVLFSHGFVSNTGSLTVAAQAKHPVFASAAGFANTGTIHVESGVLEADDDFTQTAGLTNLATGAGLSVLGSSSKVLLAGGRIAGTGTVTGDLVQTKGILAPGSGGKGALHVKGDYTLGAGGSLLARLAARTATLLSVVGAVVLHGDLKVTNAYAPTGGSRTLVAATGAMSGKVSCTTTVGSGTKGPEARHWRPRLAAHALVVTSTKGVPGHC